MKSFIPLLAALIVSDCSSVLQQRTSLVNFNHLEHLTEEINFLGDTVSIVHVYSRHPDYQWVAAMESGLEGIACVDDVARAAVVYLRHHELTGSETSFAKAKSLLEFVLKMQAEDGQFYNFILADHTINREGRTSYKSFSWWAERGVWAMSLGYRLFKERNPAFAEELRQAVERSFPHIDEVMDRYGLFDIVNGRKVPKWMIFQYGSYSSSATSELLIGLCEFYAVGPQPRVKQYIERFAEALVYSQAGDFQTFPHGAFLSEGLQWHGWANCQTQALAMAGKLLARDDWVAAAAREARWFYPRLLIEGHRREFFIDDPNSARQFPQIAYGFRPMVVGALRLAEATGDADYAKVAGLIAGWFFGNNAVGQPVYDVSTGRCHDGIIDSTSINLDSGAESTIEALYTILELEQNYSAMKYIDYRKAESGQTGRISYALFRDAKGNEITLVLDSERLDLLVLEDTESKEFLQSIKR